MKGFDEKFISEVKSKNDIVDIIGKYVRLTQRGGNFWGCCPFHHEKTPSFCINSIEQYYHCFGCHKSGDVITFIQEMENLDFADSVKFLADKAGLKLPEIEYDSEEIKLQKRKKERLLDLMRATALFYVANLKSPKATRQVEYLIKRGITPEYITKFGMGASLDFHSLPKHLIEKGFTYEEMLEAGAVAVKDGRYYDSLGERLIVPIINPFNQVIAFGGRSLEKTSFAKYKNTKDTPIFSKNKVLYNLNAVKKLKNEKGLSEIIMVEGYMDTISLVQAGIPNVVASMGTSLTKEQARMLKRYVDKVYISYDGDSAGQNATLRGLEILRDEGLEVKVISLPDGLDPDDVVKKMGASAYTDLMYNAKPLIDFKLDLLKNKYDLKSTDERRKFVISACKVIKESPSPVEQEDLLKALRDLSGFSLDALKREFYSIEEQKPTVEDIKLPTIEIGNDKYAVAVRFILYSYLFNKEYAFAQDIAELDFTENVHKIIKDYLVKKLASGEKIRFNDLYEIVSEDSLSELTAISNMDTEDTKTLDKESYFFDCVLTVKRLEIDGKIAMLKTKFASETENSKRMEIASEMNKLLAIKNNLKN